MAAPAPVNDLAVVIVTYGSAGHIEPTLRTLPTDRLAGVVVVDNASTDGTAEVVESMGLPNVTVVRNAANVGFGAGNNIGLAAAPPSRWVAFVNPDAHVDAAALAALVAHLDRTPRAALVAPRLRDGTGPITSAGRLPSVAGLVRYQTPDPLRRLLPERRLPADHDRTGPVGMVEGACMVADRAALVAIGAFDERYFLFFEEADLARRLAATGRTVELVADAWAFHAVGATRQGERLGSLPHYVRSAVAYLERWHGPAAVAAYRRGMRAAWWLRCRAGTLAADDRRLLLAALHGRPSDSAHQGP
jgi:N-acetylglucosaminyl-diphospho-decaprenol L-rhamnosyltransferase